MSWSRLIRFVDSDGHERLGDPCISDTDDIHQCLERHELYAYTMTGTTLLGPLERGERTRVQALKPLFKPSAVPFIRCIGLNYIKHIQEGGKSPPPYPSFFVKPSTSIASFNEDIPIPKIAQDGYIDYEGELALVIGKTGKNIPKDKALTHVAGYIVCNDVSARDWQRDPGKAGLAPQWCFSKGFDKWLPVGPMLVSPSVVGNAGSLQLRTLVNGEIRQDASTDDLLFGVEEIVSFCSQGTTLEAGTLILTGTPSGVAMGMKPPRYLQNGDIVEVSISGLGSVRNKMVFE